MVNQRQISVAIHLRKRSLKYPIQCGIEKSTEGSKYETYEVWLLNNETAYEKESYFKNYSKIKSSPSMYSLPLATHWSICSSIGESNAGSLLL